MPPPNELIRKEQAIKWVKEHPECLDSIFGLSGDKEDNMIQNLIDFLRAFVRPYIAYLYASVLAGLVIYAFIKYGNADMAQTLIIGFVGIMGTIVGVYYGLRGAERKEGK